MHSKCLKRGKCVIKEESLSKYEDEMRDLNKRIRVRASQCFIGQCVVNQLLVSL